MFRSQMKAETVDDASQFRYPCYVSEKLDGWRCLVRLMQSRQDQWRGDTLLIMFWKINRGRLTDHRTYGVR